MKRCLLCCWVVLCLFIGGCGWLDGSYMSVTPHREQTAADESGEVEASNYLQLRTVLENMISGGVESQVIRVGGFEADTLESSLDMAVRYAKNTFPLGAYAVEEITCEQGTSGGVAAVKVQIRYLHSRAQILQIRQAESMEQAQQLIADALLRCDTSLVMLVDNYEATDMTQLVDDYASAYPSRVMELPTVTAQTYPNSGRERVVELNMTYQTSREALRSMQSQVQRIFNSAALYVSSDAQEGQKYAQLYAFLMERFSEYQIKTSITPAYSLLNHGVGDSRAFALVFAQMCREAELECLSVVGSRDAEPWTWNMIRVGEQYYHVDLLACREAGGFRTCTDAQMESYVWDYSAYPACTGISAEITEESPEETTVPRETEKNPEK